MGYVLRHEQQAAEQGDHAKGGYHQEGSAPAEMLADEGAQRDAGDEGDGHAAEHGGYGAGRLVLAHQIGGDDRADREEHAMRKTGEDARDDQRLVARRLPGDQVAGGEQRHQPDQQQLARNAAGEGGQQRRTDGHAEGIKADQQAGGGQGDAEVGGDGGDQPDDDELRRTDGKGAEGQRQKGKGHGKAPVDSISGADCPDMDC
ncbi:hypothetical protein D3C78_1160440 [compost metagenome]